VIKLVSLVQTALYLFKLLDKDYIDGLICNETTNALWIFYTKYDPIKTTEVRTVLLVFLDMILTYIPSLL
jgi:hypothetical protein